MGATTDNGNKVEAAASRTASPRLASIDALRGFDMFFITGGSALISGLCIALGNPKCWLATQMNHVSWEGFAHHDTIFPLFLFLAGVSWPFSLASQQGRGRAAWHIQLKILARVAILFLIGLSFGGILKFKPDFRLMSVLGFIGIGWGIAATLSLYIKRSWQLFAIAVLALAGYYCLLHFCVAPGAPAGADSYSMAWNYPAYLDRQAWPTHLYYKDRFDPESFFAFPGGAALAILGVLAGRLLKRQDGPSPWLKPLILAAGAGVAFLVAFAMERWLGDQCIKKLWTPSFVLYAATYSLAMLAAFYFVVDVLKLRRWAVVFDPVGKNSILAYALGMIGVTGTIQRFLFPGLCDWVVEKYGKEWRTAVVGLTTYLVVWGITFFFKRKKVFLRV